MPPLQTLIKRGITPTVESINEFIIYLSQRQKPNYIISFFSQLNYNKVKVSSQTHSIFTWALLKLHSFEVAEQFMKTQMVKSSPLCKIKLWDSLIQGYCNNRLDPEKGLVLLHDCLKSYGGLVVPSCFTFTSLIHRFSSQGNMSKAIEVLELMINERYAFDSFVCTSVISGFCKIGKPELALQFFDNAVNSGGLKANTVVYTALVSSLRMLGRVDDVFDVVRKMESEEVAFDVVFYTSWVCGYFEEGELAEAFRKSREMVRKGIDNDTISFTVLIDGFSKEGHVEKAVGFLHKMMKEGVKPSLVTYTTILLGFCRKGKVDEAFSLFKKIEDMGIQMDEFVYAILIDGFCRIGNLDQVFHLLDDMEKKGIKPSIITYNTVINGLCKVGRTSEADEITKELRGDVITYSTLLHGYVEEENSQGILKTKQRFEEAGCKMDIVMCNILIKALFMVGAFEKVNLLYQTLPEMDLSANSITFCTLINGFCKFGRIEEALEVFDEFRRTEISSVACYNCIITGLCQNNMIDMAIEVFIELCEKDMGVNLKNFRTLVDAALEEGLMGVLNLASKIENIQDNLYNFLCNYIINILCKKGFPDSAGELCMVMKRKGSVIKSKSYYSILRCLIDGKENSMTRPLLNVYVKEYGLVKQRVCMILLHYLFLNGKDSTFYFLESLKKRFSNINFSSSIIRALVNGGKVLDAYKLVIEAEDFLPEMDVVDYSIIIDRLCKAGYPRKALDLCSFAKTTGVCLNIVTYNSVINGLCSQGGLIEAFQLFDSLERINLIPSEVTYATLINYLSKQGILSDAKQLFERMVLKGLKPNTHIYNSLIDGYCKFGQLEEALRFLSDMEFNCLEPDEFTVSALLNGYYWIGDMERAVRFFYEFKNKGISPDFFGYMYLVKGLYTKGRIEEARSILREMLRLKSVVNLINQANTEYGIESLESYPIRLCEEGSLRSIHEAVNVLTEIGLVISSRRQQSSYYALQTPKDIKSCKISDTVKSNDLEKVDMAVCDDVEKSSRFYDFGFHYSLIASLCEKGETEKANNLVREMLSSLAGNN
ncbi:hypothetical protein ACFE04_010424 [Oxalis oulophora]